MERRGPLILVARHECGLATGPAARQRRCRHLAQLRCRPAQARTAARTTRRRRLRRLRPALQWRRLASRERRATRPSSRRRSQAGCWHGCPIRSWTRQLHRRLELTAGSPDPASQRPPGSFQGEEQQGGVAPEQHLRRTPTEASDQGALSGQSRRSSRAGVSPPERSATAQASPAREIAGCGCDAPGVLPECDHRPRGGTVEPTQSPTLPLLGRALCFRACLPPSR